MNYFRGNDNLQGEEYTRRSLHSRALLKHHIHIYIKHNNGDDSSSYDVKMTSGVKTLRSTVQWRHNHCHSRFNAPPKIILKAVQDIFLIKTLHFFLTLRLPGRIYYFAIRSPIVHKLVLNDTFILLLFVQ